MNRRIPGCAFLLAAATASGASDAGGAQSEWPLYDQYSTSFRVPFANASSMNFGNPNIPYPEIAISVNGGAPITANMDTGSRGIIVSKYLLPSDFQVSGPEGYIFYWESGIKLNGRWTHTRVTLPEAVDLTGNPVQIGADLPILVIESMTCVKPPAGKPWPDQPSSCKSMEGKTVPIGQDNTTAVVGVGFDRTGRGTAPENNAYNQQRNLFLNLDQMKSGGMRSGYLITQQGVYLGLTAGNAGSGFAFGKLLPTGLAQVPGSPPDWQAPLGSVTYEGKAYPPGQVVIDMGSGNGLLTLPGQPTSGLIPNGSSLSVSLLGTQGQVAVNWTGGNSADVLYPNGINWVGLQPGRFSENKHTRTFVNTGRDLLNGFDILYDAEAGFFGLRQSAVPPGSSVDFSAVATLVGDVSFGGNFTTDYPVILNAFPALGQTMTRFSAPDDVVFNGPVSGAGGLVVGKGATVTITCDTAYSGVTKVAKGGTLKLGGTLQGKLVKQSGGTVIRDSSLAAQCVNH